MAQGVDTGVEALTTDRQRLLWRLGDFGHGHGLEIGPLHKAIVPRALADVSYVDVRDRAGLVAYYTGHRAIDTDAIPEIDFVLLDPSGAARSLPEATAAGAPFDWVMASHVIEHVPDLVGWLGDVADVVPDGGRLVLAVPDRRFTFDAHRPPTTVGQVIEAHEVGAQRPSVRAVYDSMSNAVDLDRRRAWRGRYPGYDARRFTAGQVTAALDRVRAGEYVDCHVWTFTPGELVHQLVELRRLGLSRWEVVQVEPTARGRHEFYLVLGLRSDPSDAGPDGLTEAERSHTDAGPSWQGREHELLDRIEALRAQRGDARERARDARGRARHWRAVAGRRQRRIARLEAELQRAAAGAGGGRPGGAAGDVGRDVLRAGRRAGRRGRRLAGRAVRRARQVVGPRRRDG